MYIKIRSKWNGEHWKARVFMAPSKELTAQLTGTLVLSHEQWQHLKVLFGPSVDVIEEKEN